MTTAVVGIGRPAERTCGWPDKIRIEGVSLSYGSGGAEVEVLRNIDLRIGAGEIVTLIGPSGSGKSTLLNLISNTVDHSSARISGKIEINWESAAANRLGYVFQKDTLLPWRDLLGNIEVGLEIAGVPKRERRQAAHDWISRLGLKSFEHAYPYMLSGGMRQRASIIRTLICKPEVVLLDEPFGALDSQTRMILQQMLIDLWEDSRPTICFVTHDLEESILLGHRVVLLGARPGTLKAVYEIDFPQPRNIIEMKSSESFRRIHSTIWSDLKANLPQDFLQRHAAGTAR
jgi:NitT/TauT family transport system ATP-binding protein